MYLKEIEKTSLEKGSYTSRIKTLHNLWVYQWDRLSESEKQDNEKYRPSGGSSSSICIEKDTPEVHMEKKITYTTFAPRINFVEKLRSYVSGSRTKACRSSTSSEKL